MRRPNPTAMVALVAIAALLAGCGNDDVATDTATEPATDTTAGAADTPERIVSLSPTATEMLFAIGAGDQVVAVDDQSDHPPEAPTTDLSGFQPNLEAITAHEPDLVVISGDPGDLRSGLEQLGAVVLVQPAAATLDDTYSQITELGAVTGHEHEASALVTDMKADIAELVESAPDDVAGLTYFHELDATLFTATSETFVGSVYGLLGLENIADPADADAAGYPRLSEEFVIEADPDVILLADAEFGESAETVAARPGWDQITAVRNGSIVALDADVASRWGPRVVDFLRDVTEALTRITVEQEAAAA